MLVWCVLQTGDMAEESRYVLCFFSLRRGDVLIVVGELHYPQCHISTHVFVASQFKNVYLKLVSKSCMKPVPVCSLRAFFNRI